MIKLVDLSSPIHTDLYSICMKVETTTRYKLMYHRTIKYQTLSKSWFTSSL